MQEKMQVIIFRVCLAALALALAVAALATEWFKLVSTASISYTARRVLFVGLIVDLCMLTLLVWLSLQKKDVLRSTRLWIGLVVIVGGVTITLLIVFRGKLSGNGYKLMVGSVISSIVHVLFDLVAIENKKSETKNESGEDDEIGDAMPIAKRVQTDPSCPIAYAV
mmetsp:Transcript_9605/g.15738  ORF Transcript_9605/g.15738 Transcript_9605/m.15738 type:complete len:166 (+) Transcript_9605:274-771(+)